MPQMSPLPWLTLMTMFILLIMIIQNINYFNTMPPKSNKIQNKSTIKPTWKW